MRMVTFGQKVEAMMWLNHQGIELNLPETTDGKIKREELKKKEYKKGEDFIDIWNLLILIVSLLNFN